MRDWVIPGSTFDLQADENGRSWDLSDPKVQDKCLERLLAERPYLVVGSPPCSSLEEAESKIAYGRSCLEFAARVYEMQVAAGRHFLHEHPLGATSWKEPCIEALWQRPSVAAARALAGPCPTVHGALHARTARPWVPGGRRQRRGFIPRGRPPL